MPPKKGSQRLDVSPLSPRSNSTAADPLQQILAATLATQRTSWNCELDRDDPSVAHVVTKVRRLTNTTTAHLEGVQITRYLGSGRGYRKRKKEVSGAMGAEDEEDADAELEEAGPALDYLSRPEVWKKRKSKARRAIRKLATDVVKLQALRG